MIVHERVGAEGPTELKALALVEPERCRLTNSRLQSEENQPGIARFPLNPREQSLRHSLPARSVPNIHALYFGEVGEQRGGKDADLIVVDHGVGASDAEEPIEQLRVEKAEHEGKTLDADETIEFTFAGDKISRLDVRYADQAAEDAFWG